MAAGVFWKKNGGNWSRPRVSLISKEVKILRRVLF